MLFVLGFILLLLAKSALPLQRKRADNCQRMHDLTGITIAKILIFYKIKKEKDKKIPNITPFFGFYR